MQDAYKSVDMVIAKCSFCKLSKTDDHSTYLLHSTSERYSPSARAAQHCGRIVETALRSNGNQSKDYRSVLN